MLNRTKRTTCLLLTLIMVISVAALCSVNAAAAEDIHSIDYLGYKHTGGITVIIKGDGETVLDITKNGVDADDKALTEGKDMNYFAVIVVDENGFVVETNLTSGRPDGVKSEMVCPKGGYMIGVNYEVKGSLENGEAAKWLKDIRTGDQIKLTGVNPLDIPATGAIETSEGAGFSVVKYEDLIEEGYTRVNGTTGSMQSGKMGASFDYKLSKDDTNLIIDVIVYEGLEFDKYNTDQSGASNIRFWFNGKNDGSRGLIDVYYNNGSFIVKRIVNDGSSTFDAYSYEKAEDIKADTNNIGVNLVSKSANKFNLVISVPMAALAAGTSDTLAYGLTYSSPFMINGIAYGAVHGWDTTVTDPFLNSNGYRTIKYDDIGSGTTPPTTSSEEPSSSSTGTAPTGDAGYIAVAMIAMLAIAGAVVVKKVR